ncbi:hypothetical protein M413DRAFT_450033 [Hebeloma cylindrosporum]|uniref:Uncharacterized protein n=1 Tax=Hebeloma cylindrosporum TaxID=76867 RepID=A0A0C2Y163_HEBCY|nr:hypothetical protein M413DRAFT_450033 [Hebeloma cylindrosporum h7]
MDASPFSSHIGTHYTPTSDEANQIKGFISAKIARIAEVDQEIEKLKALRSDLTLEIEDHRSLLSPIHHLPVDVLQEIFAACLPITHNPVVSRYEAPLLLTQVCRNWRDIVLSTPHFWSAIHIPIPSLPLDPISHSLPADGLSNYLDGLLSLIRERMAAVHAWLERSKGSPLSISVFDNGNCPKEVCDIVLDTIIHFSPRWKHLQLDTHSCDLTRIACLTPSEIPQLVSLVIENEFSTEIPLVTGPSPNAVPFAWSTSRIIQAPKLQELVFIRPTENIVEFPLRWSQMTCISLGSISSSRPLVTAALSLKQVAFILRSCPQLVWCGLEILLLAGHPDENQSPIHLASLESFCFHDSGVDVSSLFSILDFPSLKYLRFHSTSREGWTHSPLDNLLPRITTLERLTTEPRFFTQGHYIKNLGHMSRLTSISIRWSPFFRTPDWSPIFENGGDRDKVISDELFTWFTTPDAEGVYPVPALEHFECYTTSEFTDSALVNFIKKKYSLPGIRPLKKIYIVFARPQILDVVEEIGEEISRQLDHDLRYPFSAASLLKAPVVFHPFDGIHHYHTTF